MQGDFTRLSFDERNGYSAVLMQQGRVHLDSDWNEQVQIIDNRIARFFRDFIGQSGGPAGDALSLVRTTGSNNQFTLTTGRRYVDGLLVISSAPQTWTATQTNLGTTAGTYLVYLDVWSRIVSAAEKPELLEPALGGPDTTLRVKTESQLRVWRVPSAGPSEIKAYEGGDWSPWASSYDSATGWSPAADTAGGELSVELTTTPSDNRLYRVEIHTGNRDAQASNQPTFVWSADNGSAVARVQYSNAQQLKTCVPLVESEERARELFPVGSWIELSDGRHVADCQPGFMGQVIDVKRQPSTSGSQVTVAWGSATSDIASRTWTEPLLIRGWQTAAILLQEAQSAWRTLGQTGLKIHFTSNSTDAYQNGDYWLIPLRANQPVPLGWDGQSQHAPRRHHYAPLGLLNWSGAAVTSYTPGPTFPPLTDIVAPDPQPVTRIMHLTPTLVPYDVSGGPTWVNSKTGAYMTQTLTALTTGMKTIEAYGYADVCLPQGATLVSLEVRGRLHEHAGLSDSDLEITLYRRTPDSIAAMQEDPLINCRLPVDTTGGNQAQSVIKSPTGAGLEPVDNQTYRYYIDVTYSVKQQATSSGSAPTLGVELFGFKLIFTASSGS